MKTHLVFVIKNNIKTTSWLQFHSTIDPSFQLSPEFRWHGFIWKGEMIKQISEVGWMRYELYVPNKRPHMRVFGFVWVWTMAWISLISEMRLCLSKRDILLCSFFHTICSDTKTNKVTQYNLFKTSKIIGTNISLTLSWTSFHAVREYYVPNYAFKKIVEVCHRSCLNYWADLAEIWNGHLK